MGAYWMQTIFGPRAPRSQSHNVVGDESSRVAARVPSQLKAIRDIPCFGKASFGAGVAVGGQIG